MTKTELNNSADMTESQHANSTLQEETMLEDAKAEAARTITDEKLNICVIMT